MSGELIEFIFQMSLYTGIAAFGIYKVLTRSKHKKRKWKWDKFGVDPPPPKLTKCKGYFVKIE